MKKISEKKIHLVIFSFFTGLFLGITFAFTATAGENGFRYLDHFHKAYQIISSEYVDEVSQKEIFYGAISGMIKSLDDPFSRFLSEDDFSRLREMTTGKFVGVGIEITEQKGQIVVISPIDDSPAMHAGIMAGDIIVQVNDKEIKGKGIDEAIKLIKGISGSKVTLHIERPGYPSLLEFEIERAPIKIESVESAYIEEYNTGYIKIKTFSSDTSREVEKALKKFEKDEVKQLIIDLRYNPGGLLTSAIEISEMLLDEDKTIVSTKGRPGGGNDNVFKTSNKAIYTGDIAVLMNRGSASASEIIAAALRDNSRAVLIGEKTFGKASVQKTYNLDRDIGLAVTIARYYTPSDELIHEKGIMPDNEIAMDKISEDDRVAIAEIDRQNLLNEFITDDTSYDQQTRQRFHEFLEEKEISISDESANYILKTRLGRFVKRPVYDLEFDNQLKYALELVDEK